MRRKRIMRKVIIAVLLWVVAISRIINLRQTIIDNKNIVSAFNQVELENMSAVVETFGYYGDVYMSLETRKQMVKEIGYRLGISEGNIIQECKDNSCVTSIERKGPNAVTRIRIITIEEKAADRIMESNQYIDIDIKLNSNTLSAIYYRDVLEEIMENYGIDTEVTISLSGSVEGNADKAIKDLVTDRIISLVNGKIVTENRSDEIYTVYAYSKNIAEDITVGGRKINLNISSYYDENNNETWFYVASPIINSDY